MSAAVLVCPNPLKSVPALSNRQPLALLPLLGRPLIGYWLEHLVRAGFREVQVHASDRADRLREYLGDGIRWGVKVEVPEDSAVSHSSVSIPLSTPSGSAASTVVIDHLPGIDGRLLFESYSAWLWVAMEWISRAAAQQRMGMREIKPGVWASLRARIASDVQLHAPCWVGEHCCLSSGVVVGPFAAIEDRAFIDTAARVSHSHIGADTYVGELSEITNSIALGNILINWQADSWVTVPDEFLLCSMLDEPSTNENGWFSRLASFMASAASFCRRAEVSEFTPHAAAGSGTSVLARSACPSPIPTPEMANQS